MPGVSWRPDACWVPHPVRACGPARRSGDAVLSRPHEERVSAGALFALLAQISGALFAGVLTIFLGRSLSQAAYGHFALAVSVAGLLTIFADLGVSASASRFIAERRYAPDRASDVFRTALHVKLVLGFVTSAAMFALAGPISDGVSSPGSDGVMRGVAVAMFGQSLFLLLFGSFNAIGRIRLGTKVAVWESAIEVAATVILVLAGLGATGAGLGRAIAYMVGGIAGLIVANGVFGPLFRRVGHEPLEVPRGRLLRYALPLLLIDAAFRAFGSIDVLLVSVILGGGANVAAFDLPMRLAAFLDYPAAAAAAAVAPRMVQDAGRAPDVDLFTRVLRYAILLQIAMLPVLLVWPEAIIHVLFGDRYHAAPAVLRALSPYVFLAGVAQLLTQAANYLGEAPRRVPLALAMLGANVVVDVVLLPRIGVVAAGLGTSAAYAIWVPGHVWILHRRVALPLAALARTVARGGIAGLVLAGVLVLFGTGQVALWRMIVGMLFASAAYVATLVALRELRMSDIVAAGAIVRRRSSS